MARTRAEVRAFLESKVNTRVNDKVNSSLNGQCVTLIKALMEFLGVPNPYGARGNAKDAGNSYVTQGIGTAGTGFTEISENNANRALQSEYDLTSATTTVGWTLSVSALNAMAAIEVT